MLYEKERELKEEQLKVIKKEIKKSIFEEIFNSLFKSKNKSTNNYLEKEELKEIKKGNFQDYNFEEEELDEDDYYYDDKDL